MTRVSARTFLAACLAAGSLGFAAPGPRLVQAPMNPAFLAWQQRQLAAIKQEADQALAAKDHRFGYIPEPVAPIALRKPAQDQQFLRALPATFDLRSEGALTAVRNQNPYGTCWTFAAMASLESGLLKAGSGTFDFSEWYLAWFAYHPLSESMPSFYKKTADYGNDPNFDLGGNNTRSTSILSRGTGPVSEASCPYVNGTYTSNDLPKGTESAVLRLRDAHYLGMAFDATTVKNALMTYGALATPIYWEDLCYNSTTRAYRRLNPTDDAHKDETNHLVNIVGWNDTFAKTNFPAGNQPTVDGAWIVRNSWGPSWGESGYFYLSYDSFVYAAVAFSGTTETRGRIYQHDPLGQVGSLGYSDPTCYLSNVFTAQANENLQSVGFYAMTPGTTYEVSIRTGVTGDPSTGTLVHGPQTGTFSTPGYHTLDLSSPVALTTGQKFAVIVKLTTPGYNYPAAVEYAYTNYSDSATANPGESYLSGDGASWEDITGWKASANVCLKAIAAPPASPAPAIQAITPATGYAGSTVTLSGNGFAGATAVNFTGAAATTYVIPNDWELVATVPSGATTGPISVTTPAGTATSGTFTVTAAPEVTVSIAPQIQGYVVGQTKQFTATVTGNTNTAVTWSSTPAGLVSTTGLFTAPASATTSVTITATSAADTSKSASLSFPVRDRNLNTQGSVDVVDLATLSKYYGATGLAVGDAASCCDLNGDGKVDDDDITLFFLGF